MHALQNLLVRLGRYHRMRNDVNISARMITEYYLPAFKACVQDAKVKSIMCRYEYSSAYHQYVLGLGLEAFEDPAA